jgi:hypothetical protein
MHFFELQEDAIGSASSRALAYVCSLVLSQWQGLHKYLANSGEGRVMIGAWQYLFAIKG